MCYLFMFIRVQFVKFLKNIETYKYLKHFIIYAIITPQMALTRLTPQDASHQVMVKNSIFMLLTKYDAGEKFSLSSIVVVDICKLCLQQ